MAQQRSRREAVSRSHSVVLPVIKDCLNQMKSRLTRKDFRDDGMLRQCYLLSPDLRHLSYFRYRVLATFDEDDTATGVRLLDSPTIKEIQDGYISGSTSIVYYAILDAYVQHILKETGHSSADTDREMKEEMLYPTEWYPHARKIQRQVHLHVGPTNSGKTYNALKKLEAAGSGFYAGPLRLLAHEIFSRLNGKGLPCGLVTGDEIRGMDALPRLTSHTVEMAPIQKQVDVAVIDEIQMMADPDRGWAWTAAFLGAQAKEVHLCGEERVVPLIRELTASMGDTLHIHRYQRLNELKVMPNSLSGSLQKLRKGDCVVCFSILSLHAMKRDIEEATGRNCAIIYGSLPPEIRAQQARLFNDPDNTYDFLVASDAIGMGLNLSIKRVVFDTLYKFNGRSIGILEVPHLKQIAGRAGRYRSAQEDVAASSAGKSDNVGSGQTQPPAKKTIGLVTTMKTEDHPYVLKALDQPVAPLKSAGLQPPGDIIAAYAATYPPETPFVYILKRMYEIMEVKSRYFVCAPRGVDDVIRAIEGIHALTTADKYVIASSPASTKDESSKAVLIELARCIATGKKGHLLDLNSMPLEILDDAQSPNKKHLDDLVHLHHGLTLYIWLSFRFVDIFPGRAVAEHVKTLVEAQMNGILSELSVDPRMREELLRREARHRSQKSVSEAENALLKELKKHKDESEKQKWKGVASHNLTDSSSASQESMTNVPV